jgi:apolipoprotein N-acyltransferase
MTQSLRLVLPLKFLLGLGFALALPPLSQIWLAFVCLSLVLVMDKVRPPRSLRQAFTGGFAFGLGYFCFALHWIGFAFLVDAQDYLWMMPFAVGGLAAVMALYWGLGFLVIEWLVRKGFQRWLVLPSVLALTEWLRGILLTGFPWAVPGLMADGMGGVLQLASLVGMTGLTLLVLLWGVLPGVILLSWRKTWSALILPVLLLLTLPMSWYWGESRLAAHPVGVGKNPLIRLVQPDIAQSDKWRIDNASKIFNDLMTLTATPSASGEKPRVIIWPESALPFLLDETPAALDRIATILDDGQTLLTGAIRRQTGVAAEDYFTSILTIDHRGVVLGQYDKWRLVPGGEYLPFAWLLEPLGFRKVANLPESFSAGPGPAVSDVPGVGPALMLICYEAIFPQHLKAPAVRPRWIVNVTNDGWFGHSTGPYQHLAQVRMRAVEQGLPVARAANTGISSVIDSLGRLVVTTRLDTQVFVDARLPESLPPTVFARHGDLLFLLASLLLFILAGFRRVKN